MIVVKGGSEDKVGQEMDLRSEKPSGDRIDSLFIFRPKPTSFSTTKWRDFCFWIETNMPLCKHFSKHNFKRYLPSGFSYDHLRIQVIEYLP